MSTLKDLKEKQTILKEKINTVVDIGTQFLRDRDIALPSFLSLYDIVNIASDIDVGYLGIVNNMVERNIDTLEIPIGITKIRTNAFYNCKSLTSIIIPAGVMSIGDYAFMNCSSLESITIPSSTTSIGYGLFYNCSNLTIINVPWSEGEVAGAPWGATNATINYNYVEEG